MAWSWLENKLHASISCACTNVPSVFVFPNLKSLILFSKKGGVPGDYCLCLVNILVGTFVNILCCLCVANILCCSERIFRLASILCCSELIFRLANILFCPERIFRFARICFSVRIFRWIYLVKRNLNLVKRKSIAWSRYCNNTRGAGGYSSAQLLSIVKLNKMNTLFKKNAKITADGIWIEGARFAPWWQFFVLHF